MSITARFEDGVFRPIEQVDSVSEGQLCRVFSEEELRELSEELGWLRAAETSFDFWDNQEDAVYDNL